MADTYHVMRAGYYGALHLVPTRYGRDTLKARCACGRPDRLTIPRDTDPLTVAMAVERHGEELSSHCLRAARKVTTEPTPQEA